MQMPKPAERMKNGYGTYNTIKNFHYCSNPPRHKFPIQILLQIKLLWKSSENIPRLTQFRWLRLALIPLVNISVPTTVYSSKRNKLSHTQNLITSIFLPTSMQSQHLVKPLLFVDSHLGELNSALFKEGTLSSNLEYWCLWVWLSSLILWLIGGFLYRLWLWGLVRLEILIKGSEFVS